MLDLIYSKITAKGWNPYEMTDSELIQDIVPNGLAKKLDVGKKYILLPQVNDPDSVDQVLNAHQYMQSHEAYPIFNHGGVRHPLVTLIINQEDILVIGGVDVNIPHDEFSKDLETLESLTDIN